MKGHFFRRGDTWSYTIDLPKDPATGKRQQKKKGGFKTKKEAQVHAAKTVSEIDGQTYVKESDVTFKDFAEEWLNLYKKTANVKPSTVRARTFEIKRLSLYFSQYRLRDITRKMYQDAMYKICESYACNTYTNTHATGRMIFNKAVELGIIKNNPTQYTKLPRTQQTVEDLETRSIFDKYLEKEELALFLNTAKTKGLANDYIIFLVMAYSGARNGEVCALKWRDVDLEKGTVSITKTFYNPGSNHEKYTLLPPKSMKSARVLDIAPVVVAELSKHKTRQNTYRMAHRHTYHDADFVFAKESPYSGYPYELKNISDRMERLLKIAGIKQHLRPHSLRHTHASLLAEAGVSLPEIMERLGHKNDVTTTQIYLHATQAMKNESSKKFNELMARL